MNCPSCSAPLPPEAKFCPACQSPLISGPAGQAIDFSAYIQERTRDFTGRGWIFQKVHDWLQKPAGPRFFFLTGNPGCGKSATACQLVRFSQGSALPPGLSGFSPGFLSAVHFCSARDSSWIDPRIFSRSISLQLARSLPGYSEALTETVEKTIHIQSHLTVGTAADSATVAGVLIQNLVLSGGNSQEAFNRTVVDPLQSLFNRGFSAPVTVLVDGLDESLSHRGDLTIVGLLSRLQSLPSQVRFILTSRRDPRVENEFRDAERLFVSASEFDDLNRADVASYVEWKMRRETALAGKIAELAPGQAAKSIQAITEKSEGNFQYVMFLLEAMSKSQRGVDEAEGLPSGLDGLYYDSLKRVVELGNKDWTLHYAPFMGVLSVAQESLPLARVKDFSGLSEGMAWGCLGDLSQFVEIVPGEPGETGDRYRLYHQSVIDFLHRPQLTVQNDKLQNLYYLSAEEWHRQTARFYLQKPPGSWVQRDDYGLRYAATHLARAAQGSSQPEQHELTETLVRLVGNPDYQEAHLKGLADLVGLQRDLDQALKSAAADGHPLAIPLMVEAALEYLSFRRKQLHPEPIFELARSGNLEAAEKRLSLFLTEIEWQQAALLTLAWLAAKENPAPAKALRDRVAPTLPAFGPLPLLLARINADLDGSPLPALSLPAPPPPEIAQSIVRRLGGIGEGAVFSEYTSYMAREDFAGDEVQPGSSTYEVSLAMTGQQQGPWLVAYAVKDPAEGTDLVKHYQSILAQNNYVPYRNRFLWSLLNAVLNHPEQDWVREILTGLEAAALTGSKLEFQEGLPIALLSLRARSGDPSASQELKRTIEEAREEAGTLLPNRGKGDTWGRHKRRLTVLAEALFAVLARADEARGLLDRALQVPYGFAGFQAPACLTLAEGMRICRVAEPEIRCILEGALYAAHNIQEFSFCARTTARVNALKQHWWGSDGFDIRERIQAFLADSHSPEFSALHFVAEPYQHRVGGLNSAPLPEWMRRANTPGQLAIVFRRSTEDLQRLNPGWASHSPLAAGTPVHIPDPELAPLWAARWAAEALADTSMDKEERADLIKSLVPIAALNPTALDTVLARLLFAASPEDSAVLERIGQIIKKFTPGESENPGN